MGREEELDRPNSFSVVYESGGGRVEC